MTCCTRGSARTGLAAFLLLLVAAPLRAQWIRKPRALHRLTHRSTFSSPAWAGRAAGGCRRSVPAGRRASDARVGSAFVGAGTTFALFGRSALLLAAFPWARAKATGRIGELLPPRRRDPASPIPRFELSVNLVGGRALTPKEFATVRRTDDRRRERVGRCRRSGCSTDRTKLVNIGSNRWSFKPEFGISRAIRRWTDRRLRRRLAVHHQRHVLHRVVDSHPGSDHRIAGTCELHDSAAPLVRTSTARGTRAARRPSTASTKGICNATRDSVRRSPYRSTRGNRPRSRSAPARRRESAATSTTIAVSWQLSSLTP